jgi:hypothetical protein
VPPRQKAPLRAVAKDEKPPPRPRRKAPAKTVTQAIDASERDVLVALRLNIARDIDRGVPTHALAGLSKQLRELDKDIRAIDLRAAEEQEANRAGGDEDEQSGDEAFDSEAI